MSLSSLFVDRKARKYIKESIYNGEYKNGVCERCSCEGNVSLIESFGVCLCDSCCEALYSAVNENYEKVFRTERPTYESVSGLINEEFFYVDIEKLEKEAIANFNGSVPRLIKSYGLELQFDWNEKYADGQVFLKNTDMKSGTTKINRFLLDFDGYYRTAAGAGQLVPDADGTLLPADRVASADIKRKYKKAVKNLPYKDFDREEQRQKYGKRKNPKYQGTAQPHVSTGGVQVPNPVSGVGKGAGKVQTTNTGNSTPVVNQPVHGTQQNTNKKVVSAGSVKLKLEGNVDNFKILFGSSLAIECNVDTSPSSMTSMRTYNLVLLDGGKIVETCNVTVDDGSMEDCAGGIIELISKVPATLLPSYDGFTGSEYEITKYGVYKFKVDEYSFTGKVFTMCVVYDGKTMTKTRVNLPDKATYNKAIMNATLTEWVDNRIKEKYPLLFDGNNTVKTSVGKAVFSLVGFNENKEPVVSLDLGSIHLEDAYPGLDTLQGDFKSSLYQFIYDRIEKIIKGYTDASIKDGFSGSINKNSFNIEIGGKDRSRGFSIFCKLDDNKLIYDGEFVFQFSVLDNFSGKETPSYIPVMFKNLGVSMKDFIVKNGTEIYKKNFRKSSKDEFLQLGYSAIQKMEVSSKKQALFDKVAGIFVRKHKKDIPGLEDLEVDVRFDVNNDGYITFAEITVTDPYQDIASTGKLLASTLELDKKINYLRLVKTEDKKEVKAIYTVKDLLGFSVDLETKLLEGMIMEAFDLISVNEGSNGRKVFTV